MHVWQRPAGVGAELSRGRTQLRTQRLLLAPPVGKLPEALPISRDGLQGGDQGHRRNLPSLLSL